MTTVVRSAISSESARAQQRLVHRVEMRSRLVQDQDRRVLEEGAGDRHPLALAARKPRTALAYPGLQPLRQRGDEALQCRAADRLCELGLGRVRAGDQDVGAERVVEEVGVLRHQRDAGAELIEGPLAHIRAVEADRALRRVPEAL